MFLQWPRETKKKETERRKRPSKAKRDEKRNENDVPERLSSFIEFLFFCLFIN